MGAEEGIEWGGRPSTARLFDLSNRELIQVQRTASIFEIATERLYAERGINLIHPFPVIVTRSDSWDPVPSTGADYFALKTHNGRVSPHNE
jgi:hypothetical protein